MNRMRTIGSRKISDTNDSEPMHRNGGRVFLQPLIDFKIGAAPAGKHFHLHAPSRKTAIIGLPTFDISSCKSTKPGWRNWQTRQT